MQRCGDEPAIGIALDGVEAGAVFGADNDTAQSRKRRTLDAADQRVGGDKIREILGANRDDRIVGAILDDDAWQ